MRVYVMVLSRGMLRMASCPRTYIEFVPGVLVTVSPCAKFPNSFPNARAQISRRSGSACNLLYLAMDSPVTGWMTGAQKCSQVHGMAWVLGCGTRGWRASAMSAAAEYWRGDNKAIRADRRGSGGWSCGGRGCNVRVVGMAVGAGLGVGSGVGSGVGVVVGGELWRVCRWCIRGALRRMCLAVGFVDVSPFESADGGPPFAGHGSEVTSPVGSLVGLFVAAMLRMRWTMVVRMRRLCARGSGEIERSSSLKTSPVCCMCVNVGSMQCVGYNSYVPDIRIARVSGT